MTASSKSLLADQFELGIKKFKRRDFKHALPHFKTALQQKEIKEVLINIAMCYKELKEYDRAIEYFNKARVAQYASGEEDIDDHVSLYNIGAVHYILQNDELAREYFAKAMAKKSGFSEAAWNYSCTGLRRFCDGKKGTNLLEDWFHYDNRFKLYDLSVAHPDLELWNFVDEHKDSGVVVLRDQGRGDTLMFARYLPELEKYFGKVYLQSDPYMETLFNYEAYRDTSDVKYAVPMCSLGKLLDDIPPGDFLAYRRTAPKREGILKVGCVWSGISSHANDRNRSCSPIYFDKLTGIEKYTIGPNKPREGYIHLESIHTPNPENWETTALWETTIVNLNKLDLVITVDTAIAHLCGCLGMPCWVLMPLTYSDYRWGTEAASGENNIWYSSVKIIRNPGTWDAVFNKVQEKINES
jgi:tetratricopeptide (TPR) repeat protein